MGYCGSFVITRPTLVNEILAFALCPNITASIKGSSMPVDVRRARLALGARMLS